MRRGCRPRSTRSLLRMRRCCASSARWTRSLLLAGRCLWPRLALLSRSHPAGKPEQMAPLLRLVSWHMPHTPGRPTHESSPLHFHPLHRETTTTPNDHWHLAAAVFGIGGRVHDHGRGLGRGASAWRRIHPMPRRCRERDTGASSGHDAVRHGWPTVCSIELAQFWRQLWRWRHLRAAW